MDTLFNIVQCPNKEEHDYHRGTQLKPYLCDGTTQCGEQTHPAHQYLKEETIHCFGVCLCGIFTEPHGPGEHQ